MKFHFGHELPQNLIEVGIFSGVNTMRENFFMTSKIECNNVVLMKNVQNEFNLNTYNA